MLTVDFRRIRIRPGDRILDIGCGEGRHTIEAGRQTDVCCVGADHGLENLLRTREKVRFHEAIRDLSCRSLDLSCMDITRLPFRENSFDLVICSEVLEHIPDDRAAIMELVRILRPGSTLAVSVPRAWPEKICWKLSSEYAAADGGHLRIYRKQDLVRAFRELGLTCFSIHHAHSLHVPYWWLKCLSGPARPDSPAVNLYHRLLVWDLMARPVITTFLERLFNPVLGKSLVLYFKKSRNLLS